MSIMNSSGGNALSEQPLEVQRVINAQLASGGLASASRAELASKFDPQILQLLGGLLTQVLGAFGQQRTQNTGKKFDPALLTTFADLLSQILGVAITKSAARSMTSAPENRGEMQREYILASGDYEVFPTWSFWGETKVRMVNTGPIPVVVLINEERFQLEPGQAHSEGGKWAAFPIKVTNASETVGSQVSVTVS